MRTAKSSSVGNTKSVRNNKLANVNTNKLANVDTNKSANVGTNNSANVGTNKSAKVGTNKSANLDINKSANVDANKSANIGPNTSVIVDTIKSAKTSKTNKRGKQHKSPVRQRKPETGRKGKRVVSPRNSKKTTTKTKPKRASRSLGKKRTNNEVNGKTAIAPEEVIGEQRKHVEDDTGMSEDNSEDNAPLIDTTKSSTKLNGTVEENGEVTDSDSITSLRRDEQLIHENTVPSAGSDSDAQDADHESNMYASESIETGPHTLDEESSSETEADNEDSGSERSCTPLSNYIANKSGKGCKITIKKTSNGVISGDECGVSSRQQRQSGDCSEIAKTRKSVVSDSTAMTAIASGVAVDCKTDGSTVDHDAVSHTKSETNTDAVSDREVRGPSDCTGSDIVSACKTDKTVVDSASCCKTDSSTEIYEIAPICKIDSDTLACEAEAAAVTNAISDCETGGAGEITIAEPEHNGEIDPETNAAAPETIDMCATVSVVYTEEASSNAPELIFSCHSKHTDSNALPTEETDQSFAKPERENQEIDTADKSPCELLGPSDDDTDVQNNNVTSPAAPDEPIRLVYDRFILGWPILCKVVHLFLEAGLWHNQNLFCIITLMNFNLCCSLSSFRQLYD